MNEMEIITFEGKLENDTDKAILKVTVSDFFLDIIEGFKVENSAEDITVELDSRSETLRSNRKLVKAMVINSIPSAAQYLFTKAVHKDKGFTISVHNMDDMDRIIRRVHEAVKTILKIKSVLSRTKIIAVIEEKETSEVKE